MALTVRHTRLTLIWTETLPELVRPAGGGTALPELASPEGYVEAFRRAAASYDIRDDLTLQLPWRTAGGTTDLSHFWRYAFRTFDYAAASPTRAWQAQVALRVPIKLTAEPDRPGVRTYAEVFCHPLANSVVVSAVLSGAYTPLDLAAELASVEQMRVRREGGVVQSVRAAARTLLNRYADARRGGRPAAGGFSPSPFRLVTVLRADGDPSACRVEQGNDIHRLVEAMACGMLPTDLDDLPDLLPRSILGRAADSGGVLYAHDRARVVWVPRRFRSGEQGRWLTCYHRNLTLATAHIDAWLGVVDWVGGRLRAGQPVVDGFEVAKRAARLLGFVYGTTEDLSNRIWRSRSGVAQVEQSGLVPLLAQSRAYTREMAELKATAYVAG